MKPRIETMAQTVTGEPFETKEVSSLNELREELEKLSSQYIYRGHSNSDWELQSSLERVLAVNYKFIAKDFEKFAITFFQRRIHLYDKSYLPPKTRKLEWLSIMQHHGVQTRLLDFTYSPYVALYFALESMANPPKGKFAIYAIDKKSMQEKSREYLKDKHFAEYNKLMDNPNRLFDTVDEKSPEILWIIEPEVLNARLEMQKGCFLLSGNIGQPIENLFKNSCYRGVKNYRFIAPCSEWGKIYKLLKKMNIDGRTIYGGLEGLSKSTNLTMLTKL